MGMSDPIADMLTRIRNANMVRFDKVEVLLSRVNLNIAKVLNEAGYISRFNVKRDSSGREVLKICLKYSDSKERTITGIQRVSKPGRRVYVKSEKIPKVLNGYGVAILSTSKGIITDKEARKLKVGGEILCNVW
ncbi:MAG: 30S ribosomal protein S8 [Thermodesulfobacteriota bacterium]|nr:30S ribosomal protein S8 [Thermodesulfobacteriota bacterium]